METKENGNVKLRFFLENKLKVILSSKTDQFQQTIQTKITKIISVELNILKRKLSILLEKIETNFLNRKTKVDISGIKQFSASLSDGGGWLAFNSGAIISGLPTFYFITTLGSGALIGTILGAVLLAIPAMLIGIALIITGISNMEDARSGVTIKEKNQPIFTHNLLFISALKAILL